MSQPVGYPDAVTAVMTVALVKCRSVPANPRAAVHEGVSLGEKGYPALPSSQMEEAFPVTPSSQGDLRS